jgi:hypothetical protein
MPRTVEAGREPTQVADRRRGASRSAIRHATAVELNGWNRLAVSFREEPGAYRPRAGHRIPVEVG